MRRDRWTGGVGALIRSTSHPYALKKKSSLANRTSFHQGHKIEHITTNPPSPRCHARCRVAGPNIPLYVYGKTSYRIGLMHRKRTPSANDARSSVFQLDRISRHGMSHRYAIFDLAKVDPLFHWSPDFRLVWVICMRSLRSSDGVCPAGVGTVSRPRSSASKHWTPSSMAAISASSSGMR